MRIVFLLVLLIGIGTAGYATYLIKNQFTGYQTREAQLISQLRQAKASQIETSPVVVSAMGLSYAHELVAGNLAIIQWPSASIPANTFSTIEDVVGGEGSGVRYVKRTIDPGEPMLTTKLTNFGEEIGVNTLLEPNTRAFAIRVDVASGVSGFIQPGDEVDIYWTGDSQGTIVTRLVLERVKVIAIDQQADQDSSNPSIARTITLQVSPNIVANLVQLQFSGSLTLSLRGVEDTSTTGIIEVDTQTIIGNENNVEEVCTRTVRRGVDAVVEVIPCQP